MKEYKKMIKKLTDDELMEMIGGFEISKISISQKTIPVSVLKYGVYPVLKYGINPGKPQLIIDNVIGNK